MGLGHSVAADIDALEEILHLVRISPNWPPSPSCKALAAAGSGSSGRISLMSCRVRSFGGRRAQALIAGGYQLSLLKCVEHCQPHPQQVAHGTAVIVDRLRWNAARLPVKPSRRLVEFPVVLQWLGSEALPTSSPTNATMAATSTTSPTHRATAT
jgi:hypothetical protein